jgi:hypothetical protein
LLLNDPTALDTCVSGIGSGARPLPLASNVHSQPNCLLPTTTVADCTSCKAEGAYTSWNSQLASAGMLMGPAFIA